MKRAQGAKTGFVSRWNDQPAGTSFMAMHDGIGMVHAVEILPHQRRQGVGRFDAARSFLGSGAGRAYFVCHLYAG